MLAPRLVESGRAVDGAGFRPQGRRRVAAAGLVAAPLREHLPRVRSQLPTLLEWVRWRQELGRVSAEAVEALRLLEEVRWRRELGTVTAMEALRLLVGGLAVPAELRLKQRAARGVREPHQEAETRTRAGRDAMRPLEPAVEWLPGRGERRKRAGNRLRWTALRRAALVLGAFYIRTLSKRPIHG